MGFLFVSTCKRSLAAQLAKNSLIHKTGIGKFGIFVQKYTKNGIGNRKRKISRMKDGFLMCPPQFFGFIRFYKSCILFTR